MPDVEISLRIPNLKLRPRNPQGFPIDHADVRFKKILSVPAIPKAGDPLRLTTASGTVLPCAVMRADWHEENGLFVVACQYANRSISQLEYEALVGDPSWRMTPLL